MEDATQIILSSKDFLTISTETHDSYLENITEFEATNVTDENNSSLYIHHSLICGVQYHECNQTNVFAEYPPGLLLFGAICLICFAVIGVPGNFISILALSRCKRLRRNATTVFIINLCVADLLFCSFSLPLSAIQFIKEKHYLSNALCKLLPLIIYSNIFVSLLSVIAIAVNRYILIVHPKIYPSVYNNRCMAIMIAFLWSVSFLLLMLPLLEIWGALGYDPNVGTCTILKLKGISPKKFINTTAFVLPSVILAFCYTRIYLAVRKTSRNITKHLEMTKNCTPHNHKKELRVLRMMLAAFIVFVVCYFPATIVKVFRKENDFKYFNILSYVAAYLTNVINPVLYIAMSKEYRRAYKELFCSFNMRNETHTTI